MTIDPPLAVSRPPSFLRQVTVLSAKELAIELRTKETVPAIVIFSIASLITFQFAFDLRGATLTLVAPGVLWVAILFASLLALGRSFAREIERGSLDGILASPVDPAAFYLAKVLGNLSFMLVLVAVTVPLSVAMFGIDLFRPFLILIMFLGSFGIAAVGTILSAVAANTRAREALLPILLLPLLVPVILGAVRGTAMVLDGRPWQELQSWAGMLIAYDILFAALSAMLFHHVVEQ